MSFAAVGAGLCVVLLSGCGAGIRSGVADSGFSGSPLQGRVHGGQQPVSSAQIFLYAAGLSGTGSSAGDLLSPHVVRTDANGFFNITGDYTCPSSDTQVYLVARGGNPGLAAGTNNAALTMMAALGNCGGLTSSTYIWIDEVTTVASAWGLSQFLGTNAAVGASASNVTGLKNAFLTAQNLANTVTGSAPGSALPQGAVMETAKLNSLADVLAPCVNSDGGSGCAPLFAASAVGGSAPTTTLDAALNIVRHPGANVANVFNVTSAQGQFQPELTSAPNDWTMSITYGGCNPACGGLNEPGDLAIDSTGSVWVANYFGGVVSKFLPTGVPAAAQGFSGVGLHQSFGVTIDPQDNAWVSNETSVTGANNSHLGSISEFSSAGTELSGYGFTGGGVYYPQGVASDAAGKIWVANYGDSSASLLANDGSPISGPSGYAPSGLPFTSAVAIDSARNAWFAVQQAVARVTPAGALGSFSCCVDPAGVAIDQAGNVWLADYGGASVVELSAAGTPVASVESANGSDAPQGISIDGAGNVWAANFRGDSITELAGANAALLSPAGGFGLDAPLNEPRGTAIDASGSLWLSNAGGNTLTQMVGVAVPVKTPLLGPPMAP